MDIQMKHVEADVNPFPFYSQMRQENPVFFDPQRENYNIFRYGDVENVLSQWQIFSSEFRRGQANPNMPLSASIISTDPPKHRKLRNLVTQAFTPSAVEKLAPRIRMIVREYLDKIQGQGQMDMIADLAYPLPVIVIAEMLGVPASDRERFKHWSDEVVKLADFGNNIDPEGFSSPAIMEMGMYFMNLVQERMQDPRDDLISGLVQAQIGGEKLSMMELLGFCILLLVAGNETTTNLIANTVLAMTENPQAWQDLRQNPGIVPDAVEEGLRYRSPAQSMFRITTQEVEIAGNRIPQGAHLVAWIGSANRDGDVFEDPDRFDIHRSPNKHIAFGKGIHYCLGAPLARLEAKIAFEEMAGRFERLRLAVDPNELKRMPSLVIFGLKRLPIEFD